MTALKIAFWICLALVFYTYIGYGIVLFIAIRIKRLFTGMRHEPVVPLDGEGLPTLTLMICAYNEEEVIPEKMENIRQLIYPREKLCIMWVTDGSNDRSNELLSQYPEVTLVFSPERRGKAAAMQHGLRENKAEIVVFTDANTMLNAEALREIVRQMLKPNVSCVSGEKRVAARPTDTTAIDCTHAGNDGNAQIAAEGEGLYWKYESTLKRWDSELYSAMGAAGELFAVRMEHYREAPSNALLDDFMMSMLIVKDGHRIAYTRDAYAMEYGSASMADESKRKRRIAAGGLQSIWWLRSLMNPFAYPKVAFQFISHRVLRWSITPVALLALIPLNVALVLMKGGCIYTVIWLLQILFYAAAYAGWRMAEAGKKSRMLYVPYYFLFMNLNVFLGIRYLMTHNTSGTWEKAKRG
ncbi:MAG: glycosyltransferase family 2 protein [Prevotella sp.]|nr:glycosyltransferase family 2 protein [Prevotella sp.]